MGRDTHESLEKGGLSLNCEALNTYLDLMMDGELTDDQLREMEAHGQQCPRCAEAIRQTKQLKALLAQMEPEVDVPLPAQAKWRGAVREAARQSRRKRLYRWIGSAAAAVVVLVGVGVTLNGRIAPKRGVETAPAALESAVVSEAVESEAFEEADAAYEAEEAVAFEAEAVEAPARMAIKAAGVSEVAAENAVIEADGAATADEDDLAEFDQAPDAGMCAAVAQKTATCEAAIRVKDVDAACRQIEDLAREYEAEADVRRLEDGGASVYLTLDAANAEDLIGAIAPLNVGEDALEVPVQADDQVLQLVLTVTGE